MIDFRALRNLLVYRKQTLLISAGLTLALGFALLMALPYVYTSSARIMIEREGLFGADGTGQPSDNVNQRLHAIRTQVMSTTSVSEILLTHGLIDDVNDREALQDSVEAFEQDAEIRFDNVAVVNPYTGKAGMYSQGLIIEYTHQDPELAYAVAQDMTDRVIAAHQGQDSQAVTHRLEFLNAEHGSALARVDVAREALAAYKNEHAMVLPEVQGIALRRYQDIQTQSEHVEDNISRLQRNLASLDGELSTASIDAFVLTADGRRVLGVDEEIRLLEAEYAKAKSRYAPGHPERRTIETQLASLRSYKNDSGSGGLQAEIQRLEREVATLKRRYSDSHPDVAKRTGEIAQLRSQLAERGVQGDVRTNNATNPEYNRILIRRQSVEDELERERRKLANLKNEAETVTDQLAQMPTVEKRLNALLRDATTAESALNEIESELESMKLERGMRQANLLDHLSVVESPEVSLKPSGPNKTLMLPIIVLFAGLFSVLIALLIHLSKNHILSASDITNIIDAPVYAVPKFG